MWQLSRIALGTIQADASYELLLWGLASLCQQVGVSTQSFNSRACFSPHDGAKVVSGRRTRYLDSWVMGKCGCLRSLQRGADAADLAIVQGTFLTAAGGESSESGSATAAGGELSTLCEWLDLPRVAVVDLALLRERGLQTPRPRVDALLLDRALDASDAVRWQTELEALWGAPVLGWMDEAPALRAAIDRLRPGANPQKELCQELGNRLRGRVRLDRLFQLASRSPLPDVATHWPFVGDSRRKLRVAIALDEDFSCHFPEMLDALEAAGAVVNDFSPLKNEKLPDQTDLVLLGCGHPERHLETLAVNHCLAQSLRSYAAAGGRIFAEGSGLAYLCRQIILPDGRSAPMTGLLPATARKLADAGPPEPAEVIFGASCWLADAGMPLRGYRARSWQIEPTGSMISYANDPRNRCDLLGRGNVLGSRILTNFAAQPHLLRRFFYPYMPAPVALGS
jgi:cobyrinic acid a,c-diamide synthase